MTIKSKPYYWVECNRCGESAQEDSDYSAWSDEDAAVFEAENSGWSIRSDCKAHHCPDCPRWCEGTGCLFLADTDAEDCDFLCPLCWERRSLGMDTLMTDLTAQIKTAQIVLTQWVNAFAGKEATMPEDSTPEQIAADKAALAANERELAALAQQAENERAAAAAVKARSNKIEEEEK
jgi:hypothetical protein